MTNLPTWTDMTDLDKGAALLHLHKREWEGGEYATEHYPATYINDPRLTALDAKDACRHARSLSSEAHRLNPTEYQRIYELALNHDRNSA